MVERLWRSVKDEDLYLQDYGNLSETRTGLERYFGLGLFTLFPLEFADGPMRATAERRRFRWVGVAGKKHQRRRICWLVRRSASWIAKGKNGFLRVVRGAI
jgi:hypothetical protein